MSATASLPAPLHVKRGHIVVAVAVAVVAIVAVATTLIVRANNDSSSATLKVHPTNQQIVSTITPTGTSSVSTKAPAPAAHQSLQQIVSTITPPAPLSQSHVGGQRVVVSSQRPDAVFGPR
jgi:hypothetical protein